jgi:alpha-mannosidase
VKGSPSVHGFREKVEQRVTRYLAERVRPALYTARLPLDVTAWRLPGEPVPVTEVLRMLPAAFGEFEIGLPWGGPWATTWFHLTGLVPTAWAGRRVEAMIDLGFGQAYEPGGQAEGLVHDREGRVLHGLHPLNRSVLVGSPATAGEPVELLVEAAASPRIDAWSGQGTRYGDPATAGHDPLYRLAAADLVVRDEGVWQLMHDVEVLDGLMRELPADLPRRHEILRALERAMDLTDPRDVPGTAELARAELSEVLARPAYPSAHSLSAVGHAHIDAAWLWPLRETVRKCVRTFANVLSLAEEYPELVFACSSAQQYVWVKQQRPDLFERIKKAVATGTWVPVGGMWVEADGNLPGGEALARQLVYGRRFFADELGVPPDGVWLPDSFGYTAAYPQLARLAGAEWFLTQKLSWNETNRLPHHTFYWEGIDGSRVFTHFPPVDTYNATLSARELAHAESNFADKGAAGRSLVPFGFGDGGGGPTREMLERARRLGDLEGSPRVEIRHPSEFFRQASAEYPAAPVWRGELYLEYHRGSYTSQARTKRGNRRAEALLREAELWAATAAVITGAAYPYAELEALWQQVLLHQFHDILPGTSIAWVHQQAERVYGEVHRSLEAIIERAVGRLGPGDGAEGAGVYNAASHDRREVVVLPVPVCGVTGQTSQALADGGHAVLAEAPALGVGTVLGAGTVPSAARRPGEEVRATPASGTPGAAAPGGYMLVNGLLSVRVDADGLIRSVFDIAASREAIAPGAAGNLLQIHPDDPNDWSAWNLDHHYRNRHRDLTAAHGASAAVTLADAGPLLASVRIERSFGESRIVQHVRLAAGARRVDVSTDIDWRERDTVLKSAWPLDVHAETTEAEIQFGHVARPTHGNTSWDAARFEAWAHRWIRVGEHGYGAALITDSTYGYDTSRETRADGGATTTVRLTLLRAPHSPDATADLGRHRFSYALAPGATTGDAIAEGHALNLPLRVAGAASAARTPPLVRIDNPDVVAESVKLADDRSGDVVVRLYESRGGRARAVLSTGFPLAGARVTDLLERPAGAPPGQRGDTVTLDLRPFQIVTLRLTPGERRAR